MVKYFSPLDHFSMAMVQGLVQGLLPEGGTSSNQLLIVALKELVSLRVLDECSPSSVYAYDPHAKVAYTFVNQLLQREVNKMLLAAERERVRVHLETLLERTSASSAARSSHQRVSLKP